MKSPRMREVLEAHSSGGIEAVKKYYQDSEMEIQPMTWHAMVKSQLEKQLYNTVEIEICLMKTKFNITDNE